MEPLPTLDILAREIAQARGIESVQAFAAQIGVAWRTASDLLERTTRRLNRRVLAAACYGLSCYPHHLLRLTAQPRPAAEARSIDLLPPLGCHPSPLRIILRVKAIAQDEYGIADIRALSRHIGVAWDTAADLWYDRGQAFDLDTLARSVETLGGPAALQRLVVVEYGAATVSPRGEPVAKREAGLAVPR